MSFLTLSAIAELIKGFFHTLVITIAKTWRIPGWWKWGREHIQSEKSSSGNSLFWEVSIVELPFGEVSVEELPRYQFISETFSESRFKELYKRGNDQLLSKKTLYKAFFSK